MALKEAEKKSLADLIKDQEEKDKAMRIYHAARKQNPIPHAIKSKLKEEIVQEGAIEHLRQVKAFKTDKALKHKDGSQTKIDPTTAHALLTVHSALKPEHQEKFASHLEHSKPKFNKMLDFTWKNVK